MASAISATSNVSDLATSQTHFLQDIARNDSTDDYNTYEDLDTAALLQSLADFEHPLPSSEPGLPSTSQLSPSEDHLDPPSSSEIAPRDEGGTLQSDCDENRSRSTPPLQAISARKTNKRKQLEDEEQAEEEDENVGFVSVPKSKRQKKRQENPNQLAKGRRIWGQEYGKRKGSGNGDLDEFLKNYPSISGSDARAAGVQSAAALFRIPSDASKRYTRPPMAKIYLELEVSPPRFLQLQAAAKNYMLDPQHPDRAASVGTKSKGDTDMTKLKIFSCVTEFLEDLGWGERCWGPDEPTPSNAVGEPAETPRRLQWPKFKPEIVTLVTPLFRRMVTNERQRLYALEVRQKKSVAKKLASMEDDWTSELGTPEPLVGRMSAPSPSPYPAIDPNLKPNGANIVESTLTQGSVERRQSSSLDVTNEKSEESFAYVINIMESGRRIRPKATSASCSDYLNLVRLIDDTIDDKDLKVTKIKILGPGTWLSVGSDEELKEAVDIIKASVYMDGEVKCIVEVVGIT